MAWMKVTSSPTWSNWPCASSSSSSAKFAAASGDSDTGFFQFPAQQSRGSGNGNLVHRHPSSWLEIMMKISGDSGFRHRPSGN